MGCMGITCKNDSKESSKWAEASYLGSSGIVGFSYKISRCQLDNLVTYDFVIFSFPKLLIFSKVDAQTSQCLNTTNDLT